MHTGQASLVRTVCGADAPSAVLHENQIGARLLCEPPGVRSSSEASAANYLEGVSRGKVPMTLDEIIRSFSDAVYDTDRDAALRVIHDAVDNGVLPEDIVSRVIVPVVEQQTCLPGAQDLSLAQHFLTAQIAAVVVEEMLPRFRQAPEMFGRVVIGSSQGDLHSLGKRIVIGCLKAHMIEAIDLGVSVPPERFVDEAVASGAQVIGISSMMVHTARGESGCLKVRQILKERGLEGKIKIIVGGAPYRFDPQLYRIVQADAWAESGVAAGTIIKQLIEEARS